MFELTKSDSVCGKTTWQLPMSFGVVQVTGAQCPVAPGTKVEVHTEYVIPKLGGGSEGAMGIGSGNMDLELKLEAKDQDGELLFCGSGNVRV